MATQEKIIRVNTKKAGGRRELDSLLDEGWKIKHTGSYSQGYSFRKTCCLGFIFLPLALLGRKPDVVEYVLEKEFKSSNKSTNSKN